MRMDQGNTMRPEPHLALYDQPHLYSVTARSTTKQHLYQLVEGITRKIYILEGHTSTQKMRMDQENTMRSEPALYDAASLSYTSTMCTS